MDVIGIYRKDIIIVTVFCGVGDCICFCGGDIVDIDRQDIIDIVDTGGWNVSVVGRIGLDGGKGNGTGMDRWERNDWEMMWDMGIDRGGWGKVLRFGSSLPACGRIR